MLVNGKQIKVLRGEKPLAGMMLVADLSERRLQQIESQESVNLNTNVAKAIARYLGVHVEAIKAG